MVRTENCPLCNSEEVSRLYSVTVNRGDHGWGDILLLNNSNEVEFDICFCNFCKTSFRDKRFTENELELIYSDTNNTSDIDRTRYWGRSIEIYDFIRSNIDTELNCGNILDIGGNRGEISDWFVETRNSTVDVYEFSGIDSELKDGMNIIANVSSEIKYDLMMCNHVLEHVNQPSRFLSEFVESLKDGGLLYIEVPFELFHYFILKTKGHFEHLNYFGKSSMSYIAHSLGLLPLSIDLRMGYGSSIPVISALLRKPLAPVGYQPSLTFSLLSDVISAKSIYLFAYSKLRVKFGMVDNSHSSRPNK